MTDEWSLKGKKIDENYRTMDGDPINIICYKYIDILNLRKKMIEDIRAKCLRDEHDPNLFLLCAECESYIEIINTRFGVE